MKPVRLPIELQIWMQQIGEFMRDSSNDSATFRLLTGIFVTRQLSIDSFKRFLSREGPLAGWRDLWRPASN
jgi:hypothetical protein